MSGEEQQTGTQDEQYNLISALYHLLKGASTSEQYIQDAQEAGDQELAQFFKDWQEEQRNFAERAKNLLNSRMLQPSAGVGASGASSGKGQMKDVTNANVKSGGNETDDAVDEQSKESFPASDAPGSY